MELRQLRYFLTVAQELHFGNAARKMNISQPPLSMQIKQLEEELEMKLFNRTSRFVELTPQGEYLKREVEGILNKLDLSVKTAKKIAKGNLGILKVGFVAIVTQLGFPGIIRDYKKKFPGVSLELKDLSSSRQIRMLREHDLDIGFINSFAHDLKDLEKRQYAKGKFKIAIPSTHRLASRKKVSLGDFQGENIIMFKKDVQPVLFDSIIESFKKAGAEPFSIQEINQRITSLALVAAGMGICPVSPPVEQLRTGGDVLYKPVKDPFPEFELAAVWSGANSSRALHEFLDIVF
jgi:DNA-binding transcriptional LysR family regulator